MLRFYLRNSKEKPLRVFKRNRRLAIRIAFCIWLVPFLIWIPLHLADPPNGLPNEFNVRNGTGVECVVQLRKGSGVGLLIALPVLYMPAVILVSVKVGQT